MANAAIGSGSPTEEEDNGKLSYVELIDDNDAILLNGSEDFKVKIPLKIKVKKDFSARRSIIESAILDGCTLFHIDYVSESNITSLANEVTNQLYERSKVERNLASMPPSSPDITDKYENNFF